MFEAVYTYKQESREIDKVSVKKCLVADHVQVSGGIITLELHIKPKFYPKIG